MFVCVCRCWCACVRSLLTVSATFQAGNDKVNLEFVAGAGHSDTEHVPKINMLNPFAR